MALTKKDLDQFTATSRYWRHWTGKIVCTDGVTYLADRAQASWLIDAIALLPDAHFSKRPDVATVSGVEAEG